MLAYRRNQDHPPLAIWPAMESSARASIGARRNPASTRAILEAAQTLLERDGLAGFSIDAIARLARCGKPTLYRWWPDKASLLADLHDRAVGSFYFADASLPFEQRVSDLASQWSDRWHATFAGVALRGLLVEAQLSASAHQMLNDRGLAPYRASLAALIENDASDEAKAADLESLLQQTLLPLLGGLMVMSDGSASISMRALKAIPALRAAPFMRSIPQPSTPPADAERIVSPVTAGPSIRHRGEWVD